MHASIFTTTHTNTYISTGASRSEEALLLAAPLSDRGLYERAAEDRYPSTVLVDTSTSSTIARLSKAIINTETVSDLAIFVGRCV